MNDDFRTFLAAKLKESGLNLKKLSELTGIALKHLENINSGNFNDLPAAPYLRGYLVKISEVLDFKAEDWWQVIQKEKEIISSGRADSLPKNRFNKKVRSKKFWLIGLAVLILISYFGIRFKEIFGRPNLKIDYPAEESFITNSNEIILIGTLENGDKVLVNEESVLVEEDGSWKKNLPLEEGLNLFEITAKKFLGREVKITRQIVYEPDRSEPSRPAASSTPISSSTEP